MQTYNTFLHESSYQQRSFIILTTLAHGFMQFNDNGAAFYFLIPQFECKSQNQYYEKCTYQDACSQKFEFKISDTSPQSLSTQFHIFCENEYLKAQSISIMFFMAVFASIFLITFKIRNNHIIFAVCLAINIFSLTMFQFQISLIGKSIFLGLAFNLTNVVFTANFWILQKQILNEKMSQILGPIDGIVWGVIGMFIPIVLLTLNGNISQMMIIITILQSLILAKFLNDFPLNNIQQQKQFDLDINVIEIFKNNPQLLKNALIQSFEFVLYCYSIICIAIEIQSFGGDIYLNMIIFELCSIVANMLSSGLTLKEKFPLLTFMGIIQLIYLFKTPQTQGLIFLLTIFVIKITGEVLYTLQMKTLFQYLPLDIIQFYLGCNQFCARLSLVLLPYTILLIRSQNIHPLFVFGIMTLVGSYLQKYKKLLNIDEYDKPDVDFVNELLPNIEALSMRHSFYDFRTNKLDIQQDLIRDSFSIKFSITRQSALRISQIKQENVKQIEIL